MSKETSLKIMLTYIMFRESVYCNEMQLDPSRYQFSSIANHSLKEQILEWEYSTNIIDNECQCSCNEENTLQIWNL